MLKKVLQNFKLEVKQRRNGRAMEKCMEHGHAPEHGLSTCLCQRGCEPEPRAREHVCTAWPCDHATLRAPVRPINHRSVRSQPSLSEVLWTPYKIQEIMKFYRDDAHISGNIRTKFRVKRTKDEKDMA